MNRRYFLIIFSTLLSSLVFAQLDPKILLDKYLLAIERYYYNEDYHSTAEYCEKALALNLELPEGYYILYADSLFVLEDYLNAKKILETYLNLSNSRDNFYYEILDILIDIDEFLSKKSIDPPKRPDFFIETNRENILKVVLYVNGTLGDKSFFDSAAAGVNSAVSELGILGKIVEGGYDPARWESDIAHLCEGDWDIIIAGTWQLQEYLEKYAPRYPEKKFITFDTSVNYNLAGLYNVYSILYSQNEGSFLAGVAAAMITGSNIPGINNQKVIGFLGGMDIPVINDYKIGFTEGALYFNSDIQILSAYTGTFSDPVRGQQVAQEIANKGADVIFTVAGETGLGVIHAAYLNNFYVIGVDSDMYLLFSNSDPKKASQIATSMVKNIEGSIFRAIKKHLEGSLPYGEAEVLGVAENGVSLADNANYRSLLTPSMRNQLSEIEAKIASGEIIVGTAFGVLGK